METMKAVRFHAYGDSSQLIYEDAPKPRIADDEVLVRVCAAAVNPLDWKVRSGYFKQRIAYSLPLIPGWDVSGVVEARGANVSNVEPGDAIYAHPDIRRNGAYAEYVAVRASEIAAKPTSLNHVQAAAVPLAALTAWQALFDKAHLVAGQTILIHAAAGGVGIYAVQLAKWKGAKVIGTASQSNHSVLRELGADEVVDYKQTRFFDVVRDTDIVFDTIGGETQRRSWSVLRPGGVQVSIVSMKPDGTETVIASPPSDTVAAHSVRGKYFFVQPNNAQLTRIAQLIDAGSLKTVVSTVLPLTEARQAHELSQSGHTCGKIVLQVTKTS